MLDLPTKPLRRRTEERRIEIRVGPNLVHTVVHQDSEHVAPRPLEPLERADETRDVREGRRQPAKARPAPSDQPPCSVGIP